MKLETIHISGFRSISDITLPKCGGFNVIIGKNNSGKSNILLAINTFYTCLRDGEPVFLDPPVGKPVDRFGVGFGTPINIGMVFSLSLAERDNLIQDIVSESPQVKNTVDGMDPELMLGVLISIPPNQGFFAYVKRNEPAAELDVDHFLVQVNGAGIREALRLILDFEFSRPDVLLVEEPEIHLHPALETSIMRYLKRAGEESQIFITTHSTNFLDTADMRNVYLTSKNGSTNGSKTSQGANQD